MNNKKAREEKGKFGKEERKIKALSRLRVKRVKRVKACKLRVTRKTCNPHRKMYGFTRNNA